MNQARETLGQYLKREREAHRVPVDEIALITGMKRSLIDALEGDDFDDFVQRSEVVQLVKQYIDYMKLNETEALRLLDMQWKSYGGVKRYPKLTHYPSGELLREKPAGFKGKKPIVGVAIIIAFFLLISLPGGIQEITPPVPPPPPPPQPSGMDRDRDVLPALRHALEPAANVGSRTNNSAPAVSRIAPPAASQSRPAAVSGRQQFTVPSAKEIRVIGNRDTKRYHLPGMKYYDKVKAYHRVVFQSEKEAIRAGYAKARE